MLTFPIKVGEVKASNISKFLFTRRRIFINRTVPLLSSSQKIFFCRPKDRMKTIIFLVLIVLVFELIVNIEAQGPAVAIATYMIRFKERKKLRLLKEKRRKANRSQSTRRSSKRTSNQQPMRRMSQYSNYRVRQCPYETPYVYSYY